MRPGLLLSALVLAVVVACGSPAAPGAGPAAATDTSADPGAVIVASASEGEITVEITELMCLTCRSQIAADCRKIPGVTEVSVDLAARTMTLRFDGAVTNKERVVAAVETVVGSIP